MPVIYFYLLSFLPGSNRGVRPLPQGQPLICVQQENQLQELRRGPELSVGSSQPGVHLTAR